MMNIGDKLCLTPTIVSGAFMQSRTAARTCRVVAVNPQHRHFTVEFTFPGGTFQETYKEVDGT